MTTQLQLYEEPIADALADHREALSRTERESAALESLEKQLADLIESQSILQGIAKEIQQQAHQRISEVVTRCLNAVFDDPYEFRIDFVAKRGKTEARLLFVRDGVELHDPVNEVGGGVIDVASLALRVAVILLAKPARRRLIILDEPFKYVRGKMNQQRTREMLTSLSEELGIQFIINTDIPAYRLGKIIETGGE